MFLLQKQQTLSFFAPAIFNFVYVCSNILNLNKMCSDWSLGIKIFFKSVKRLVVKLLEFLSSKICSGELYIWVNQLKLN